MRLPRAAYAALAMTDELALNLPDNAQFTGLSPSRYSSVFKEVYGVSPQNYLVNYRLRKAKELMRHTNLTIKQISSLTGFEDQLYFSRLFKKHEKMSPKVYIGSIR